MITAKKLPAAFLAAVLFVSSVMITGCDKKKIEEKVSADDPWFSAAKIRIGDRLYQDKENWGIDSKFIGLAEDKAVFLVSGSKRAPEGVNEEHYDFFSNMYYFFEIYSGNSAPDVSINIKDKIDDYIVREYGDTANWNLMSDYNINNRTVTAMIFAFLPAGEKDSYVQSTVYVDFDVESGEITGFKTSSSSNVRYTEESFEFDGYSVKTSSNYWGNTSSFIIEVIQPDGTKFQYDGEKLLTGRTISGVYDMLYMGDGRVVVSAFNDEDVGMVFYEMDLKTGQFKEYTGDDSFIRSIIGSVRYMPDVGNVIVDGEGIKKVDIENGSKTVYFSFDDCNLNRSETNTMELLAMTEDKIYMSAYPPSGLGMINEAENNALNLYILTKEKTNPHAGKTIIHATSLGEYSYSVCEAVSVFNDTNPEYFIQLDNKYSSEYLVSNGGISIWDENYGDKLTEATIELTYQLKIDLMNGEGPDIVIGGAEYTHLNSIDCFLDLKPEINTDGLFENVIAVSERDGKLYQCPLAFYVTGIVAPKKDVDQDQCGFTYDQYKDFVSGPCNGEDPLSFLNTRTGYFTTCVSKMQDACWDDEKQSYDTPAFRRLAEYVSANVIEKTYAYTEYSGVPVESSKRDIAYESMMTFPYFMYYYSDSISDMKILGAPSVDGRGPSIKSGPSVGIAAQTEEKNACIEFVKLLLSEEIQESFEDWDDCTPLRRSAFETAGKRQVDAYNENYHQNASRYTRIQLMEYMFAWCEIDNSAVDEYEKMIGSCKSMTAFDPALEKIIVEEMPAYFTRQKSLDEVITIINDRSKTYISERS